MDMPDDALPQDPGGQALPLGYPCLCGLLRKGGRILTRRYDQHLKPSGLKITQFGMLANIARNPGITVSRLAELLLLDQTTATRNLAVLETAGHVRLDHEAADRRVRTIHLTEAGRAALDKARPFWTQAQLEMEEMLGRPGIEALLAIVRNLGE
jgi:MarR family transcriptional regulator, organic hydroperoxide resistance regulator